jgi:SsrA-binding protein
MSEIRVVATNRKAFHEYFIEDRLEAGIVLSGTEIKSVRAAQVSLQDSYVQIQDGELWMMNVHIAPYEQAGRFGHDPKRPRKLLLHRKEITRLLNQIQIKGYTLIPLRLYLKGKVAKVELALARGKHQYDKRESIAKRDEERRMRYEWKEQLRG